VVFIVLFLAVAAAGAWFDWQEQWEALSKAKQEEQKHKETFLAKKKEAINLDLIRKQLTETQESFGALLKQLPSKSEMDALLTDINQAVWAWLQFELFRPGAEKVVGSFAEQPITIKVSGNYDDIGKFSSDIAMLPRIVTLGDIAISPAAEKRRQIHADHGCHGQDFPLSDEQEMAAQKKAAVPAKGAKK